MIETDYPHTDSTLAALPQAGARAPRATSTPEVQYKILRGNAERLFNFTPAKPPTPKP